MVACDGLHVVGFQQLHAALEASAAIDDIAHLNEGVCTGIEERGDARLEPTVFTVNVSDYSPPHAVLHLGILYGARESR